MFSQNFSASARNAFFLLLFALVGCIQQTTVSVEQQATEECESLCLIDSWENGWENGKCLSNEIIEDWVCDVAHSPRQPVDDLPENQCSAFREGKARHFVELNTECEVIKTF